MIIYYLLQLLIAIGTAFTSVFGSVSVLPFGIDSIVSTAVSYFYGAIDTVPYLEVVWDCFLWIILFEVSLLIGKLILGSRMPTHNINLLKLISRKSNSRP